MNLLKTTKEGIMLVLSRKQDETITIGGGIKVTVVKIDKGTVKLGIEAPESVNISREEDQRQKSKRNNYLML